MLQHDWQACLHHFSTQLPDQQYKTWVAPLIPLSLDTSEQPARLSLGAPNRFKQNWAREHLVEPMRLWWQAHLGHGVHIDISLVDDPAKSAAPDAATSNAAQANPTNSIEPPAKDPARLNHDWTFENFVPGKANQLARAAALQVSENPGSGYNPLFLYGGVGLGKSHLIHAVGNQMSKRNPQTRIRYIHAEAYVSDVVRAYQRKSFDDIKLYYHSLDLLLIDDIQFFAGKTRTQEEFFYTFEALVAAKKQIIITSDTYPSELNGIDTRLISRFGSGLTVAIEPPELEMRVAILLKKAEQENLALSEDEAFFIARQLKSNVRELEGALRKVIAYCHFHQVAPSLEVVKEALRDLLSIQKTSVSIENIQKVVADYYKIKVADMYSKRRPANIAHPRQVAMYLAKELTQKSLPDIGDSFGGRDHTTVLHAVRKISEQRQHNTELNRAIHILEQHIRG
jgi:chromosomal replication initiator protein